MASVVPSLAFLRRKAGLSQAALAAAVGVTPMSVSNYEAGRNGPSTRTMVAIAETLGVTVDDLLKQPSKKAPKRL
jgi:transcriptional regulator with XRE-family HTH domain